MITPPSQEYLDQLRHTHQARLRVTLYSAGVEIGEIPVSAVDLNIDGTGDIWRSASITAGVDFYDTINRDRLELANVQSGELKIEHGVRWTPSDTFHWAQLAYLRVDALNMALLSAGRDITAFDRALLLQEHHLPTPRPLNKPYVELIEDLLAETLPGETLIVHPSIDTVLTPAPGKALNKGRNRLSEIRRLADVLGARFHNDENGAFVLSPYETEAEPVWEFDDGPEGVLEAAAIDYSRSEQYNAVGIEFSPDSGSDEDWALYVYAWDNDPDSPTFYDGPFGKRNVFYSEEYDHMPSDTEAVEFAKRKLAEVTGATRGMSISTFYNPLLQPGDHVLIHLPDRSDDVVHDHVEEHVIDKISMNLGRSARMDIETTPKRDPGTFGTVVS